jgi:hypothetical protein
MFSWLGDAEQSCYIYETFAPSLVLKTQDQLELCQVFCIVMLPYNRGQEILETFLLLARKKYEYETWLFHMTMGEVSE